MCLQWDAPIVESVMSSEKNYKEVKLDPEEHYVALRSYVQGIAEVGLEMMFASRYPDDPLSLPFGFNTLMQKQVLHCLKELCPNAAKSILYKAVGYVLESAPDEWIKQRLSLLNDTYGFITILKEHEFWEMQDEAMQKRIVALYGKLTPPKHIDGMQGHHVTTIITDEQFRRELEGQFIPHADNVLGEDQIQYFVSNVKAVLNIRNLDEELLRRWIFQAVAEIQARNPHMVNGFVPAVVHRAADLYREHALRQYGIDEPRIV